MEKGLVGKDREGYGITGMQLGFTYERFGVFMVSLDAVQSTTCRL